MAPFHTGCDTSLVGLVDLQVLRIDTPEAKREVKMKRLGRLRYEKFWKREQRQPSTLSTMTRTRNNSLCCNRLNKNLDTNLDVCGYGSGCSP